MLECWLIPASRLAQLRNKHGISSLCAKSGSFVCTLAKEHCFGTTIVQLSTYFQSTINYSNVGGTLHIFLLTLQTLLIVTFKIPKPPSLVFHSLVVSTLKQPPPPSLSPLFCRKDAKPKEKENVKAYYLSRSNGIGVVCRNSFMRSYKYRDNLLYCRFLSDGFLLFAVGVWRLQGHKGGEWLKLLRRRAGM